MKLWDIVFLLMTCMNSKKQCYYSIAYEWNAQRGKQVPILQIRVTEEIVAKLEALEEGKVI